MHETIFLIFVITIATISTQAQKLPNKQEAGSKAPANIKIDGKLNEWDGFKADNSATGLLYTIANDDQNLYLVTQTKIWGIRDKVWSGGISLIFTNTTAAGQNAISSLTYAALPKERRTIIADMLKDTLKDIDAINKAIAASVKTMAVKNIDGIAEDLISIYNNYGITAASYLTDKNTYTCEMAIPLKYLKIFINAKSVIKYSLQVNAMSFGSVTVNMNGKEVDGSSVSPQLLELINKSDDSNSKIERGAIPMKELVNNTNVSGEYTLAKWAVYCCKAKVFYGNFLGFLIC